MFRYVFGITTLTLVLLSFAFALTIGCSGSSENFATPLYIQNDQDPFSPPDHYITGIWVTPAGVNLAVGGIQQFLATVAWNDGTTEDKSNEVDWYTETPAIGAFEPAGGRFLAQNPGVGIVRCRMQDMNGWAVSTASFVNSFNPNADLPPAVPLNPDLLVKDEGVMLNWDLNQTDGDLAGYNVWRTQVSAAHYTTDYGKVNDYVILYPPYLDSKVVSGWYYYRVTAEDLLGFNSAPSEEVAAFVTGQSYYGSAWD